MTESGIRAKISAMRRSYGEVGLEKLPTDPFVAFEEWMAAAAANEIIVEANAMVLSTADGSGEITTRTVLLKDISQGGFTFFTNYSSRKAQAIAMNSQVTLLFPWYAMEHAKSLRVTLQQDRGRVRSVRGLALNQHRLLHAKS